MAKTNPEMIINEIQDIYLRRNFLQLDNYFKSQNQLLDFKFFEVKFTATTLNQTVNHGLKFIPKDVVFLGATNNATVSFNVGKFTLTTLDITANKETTLRFFVGKYFNDKSNVQPAKEDVLVFGPDSLDSSSAINNEFSYSVESVSLNEIDWSKANMFTKILGSNTSFIFSKAKPGQSVVVRLTNTASNYTVTWPSVRWAGGTPPVMSPGAVNDVYTFIYDGSHYYGAVVQAMT